MTDREKLIRIANDWYDEAFKASRKKTIDEVLAIVDEVNEEYMAWHGIIKIIRDRVLALKGGEHESIG